MIVEHPAGSRDGQRRLYPLNCGYVQQVLEEENRWQDACILDEKEPVEWFDGQVVAEAVADGRSVWLISRGSCAEDDESIRARIAFLGGIQQINR